MGNMIKIAKQAFFIKDMSRFPNEISLKTLTKKLVYITIE